MSGTIWSRLEPVSRDVEMRDGVQAVVHDPLWMLARQWQLGEFRADDAGSPALVEIWTSAAPMPRDVPLEVVVERERLRHDDQAPPALAVEAGLHFLRLLEMNGMAKYHAPFITAYPVAVPSAAERAHLDPQTLGFLDVTAGRAPHGARLHAAIRAATPRGAKTAALPKAPAVAAADAPKVLQAVTAWLAWFEGAVFSEPAPGEAPSWRDDRLEYEFTVRTPPLAAGEAPVVLTAPEYVEGHLDWYTFDAGAVAPAAAASQQPATARAVPVPITFPGMPASRYWEFEDATVNLSAVTLDATGAVKDVAALLLLEFALVYGNDWFVVPLPLPVGSVCRIDRLQVTDTFGERTTIGNALAGGDASWAMFSPGAPVLVLPPSLVGSLHSPVIEEVLFVRDEMANLAWAVERVVEGGAGSPVQRYEEAQARRQPAASPAVPGAHAARLAYELSTEVPEHWIPLVPIREPAGGMHLERAQKGASAAAVPRGRILGGASTIIREEEVPRGGARVTRAWQYARWIDGSTCLWVGRRKVPGRGEASSGLQFDRARAIEPA